MAKYTLAKLSPSTGSCATAIIITTAASTTEVTAAGRAFSVCTSGWGTMRLSWFRSDIRSRYCRNWLLSTLNERPLYFNPCTCDYLID